MIRPERVLDYTSTPDLLDKGIDRIGARTQLRQQGAHLVSAFLEAAQGLRKDGTRTQPAGAAPATQQIADELQRGHLVTYTMPPGAKPSDRLKVSTRTNGLKLRAPSRIPK